jgi:hypothetical protein
MVSEPDCALPVIPLVRLGCDGCICTIQYDGALRVQLRVPLPLHCFSDARCASAQTEGRSDHFMLLCNRKQRCAECVRKLNVATIADVVVCFEGVVRTATHFRIELAACFTRRLLEPPCQIDQRCCIRLIR